MTAAMQLPATLVVGVGNDWRRDDAAGLEVARRLRGRGRRGLDVREQGGEPAALIESMAGAGRTVIVDAVSSGARPGTVHRHDAVAEPLPGAVFGRSTHAVGVPEAVELARALGRLPRRLLVCGVEGESFELGRGLTPAVAEAVDRLAGELAEELGD